MMVPTMVARATGGNRGGQHGECQRAGPVRHRLGVEVEHLVERRRERNAAAAFERFLGLQNFFPIPAESKCQRKHTL